MCLLRAELRGFSASTMTPGLCSKTQTHDPGSSGQINDDTAPVNRASSTSSRRATCSASAVDNVTHLCVLLAQLTAAPPQVVTAPDTVRLSFDLSAAQSASLYALRSNPEPLTKVESLCNV